MHYMDNMHIKKFICSEDYQKAENFLRKYDMQFGKSKTINNKLLNQLNRSTLIARSMRCVYLVDDFIIKTSSDSTSHGLPLGADQCLNEFNIFHSTDERLEEFKQILCPIYTIYESKFIYLTVYKKLNPLCTSNNSHESIYSYLQNSDPFQNQSKFIYLLEKFKKLWVTQSNQLQNEYCKISTFGYDENRSLYLLDYGML